MGLRIVVAWLGSAAIIACTGARGQDRNDGTGSRGNAPRPVSVLTAKVEQRDVPIVLEGLGTVTAYKMVTVHTLVDGRLDSVAFREGQEVKRGELLAQVDPRPFVVQLHLAEASLARDSAQLGGNKVNLGRYEKVGEQKLIPQQQVDDQRVVVAQLDAAVRADQASIAQAKLMLDYARIRSPIDGVVGVRLVDPGNLVHPADPSGIVVVTQVDPIAVLFTLPQDDLPRVAAAMAEGKPTVEALSRTGSEVLGRGELEVLDNQINTATATIRLKAIFSNPRRRLWPNQFVKARLELGVRKNAVGVPAVAVQNGPSGSFVYVVDAAHKAEMRPVDVASIDSDFAVIGKGLRVGETVVTEGQFQLKPGATVEARPSGGAAERGGRSGAQQGGPGP